MITSETFRNRKESSDKFEGEATNCDPKYQSFGTMNHHKYEDTQE